MIKVRTVFLLEDSSSLSSLLEGSKQVAGEHCFVSLSPEASYAFERAGISHTTLRHYRRNQERYQIGLENFHRILRFTAILDKELAHLHGNSSLTPAKYTVFLHKLLFDNLWDKIHIVRTILEVEQPDNLRLYTGQSGTYDRIYGISNDESIYAGILAMRGWNTGIEIFRTEKQNVPDIIPEPRPTIISQVLAKIKQQDLFFNLGLIGKRKGILAAASALYHTLTKSNEKPVLIYNSGYNWDDSLDELCRAGISPVFRITDEDIDRQCPKTHAYNENVYRICSSHPAMKEFETVLGIDVSSFFFDRAARIAGNAFNESIFAYEMTRKMIRQKKIRGLLLSIRERSIGHAVVQAAHDEGIPVISWQHGGAGYYYHPIMPFLEFLNSDLHFVFGRDVAESYTATSIRLGLDSRTEFIVAGSSSLDAFHYDIRPEPAKTMGRPVVYITTAYVRNWYTIPNPDDPSDCNEHLWRIQRQVIDLAKKHPERKFIIKFHASQKHIEPVSRYIRDNGLKNMQIIRQEMSVRELAEIADIVIFDVISTAILQVLTSDTPVFAHAGLFGYDPGMIVSLKKRAYVSSDTPEFVAGIDKYLRERKVPGSPVDVSNTEFLVQFGTDIHQHNSAETAVKKLNVIIL